MALRLPAEQIAERVARRVDEQFERGLLDEMRGLLARGVPESARPFGGLVYRQALEHLQGVRDEAATRALITQENRRYARRQLIWFRKEPNLIWLDGPGDSPADHRRRRSPDRTTPNDQNFQNCLNPEGMTESAVRREFKPHELSSGSARDLLARDRRSASCVLDARLSP